MKRVYFLSIIYFFATPCILGMQKNPDFILFICKGNKRPQLIDYDIATISTTIQDLLNVTHDIPTEKQPEGTNILLNINYDCETVSKYLNLLKRNSLIQTNILQLSLEDLYKIIQFARFLDIKIPDTLQWNQKVPAIGLTPEEAKKWIEELQKILYKSFLGKAIDTTSEKRTPLLRDLPPEDIEPLKNLFLKFYADNIKTFIGRQTKIQDLNLYQLFLLHDFEKNHDKITIETIAPLPKNIQTILKTKMKPMVQPANQENLSWWSYTYIKDRFNTLQNSISNYKKQILFGLTAMGLATAAAYKYWYKK